MAMIFKGLIFPLITLFTYFNYQLVECKGLFTTQLFFTLFFSFFLYSSAARGLFTWIKNQQRRSYSARSFFHLKKTKFAVRVEMSFCCRVLVSLGSTARALIAGMKLAHHGAAGSLMLLCCACKMKEKVTFLYF